jgi:hypothetical protein
MRVCIEIEWRQYIALAIPANAPDIQRTECKCAFFAGAQAFYRSLITLLEPGKEPTDADLFLMKQLEDELDRFCRDVERGAA